MGVALYYVFSTPSSLLQRITVNGPISMADYAELKRKYNPSCPCANTAIKVCSYPRRIPLLSSFRACLAPVCYKHVFSCPSRPPACL